MSFSSLPRRRMLLVLGLAVLACAALAPLLWPSAQARAGAWPHADHVPAGRCGEDPERWHAPVIQGCAAGHEHGDAPPQWLLAAGYTPSFHGHFNTSPAENAAKHAAMKGFAATFDGVELYVRLHMASNVLDRAARYHSYEIWARDPQGGISHWQGWADTGDPVADRVPRRRDVEPAQRPVVLVVDQTAWDQGIRCEQWYLRTAEWSWDIGWTICGSTTLYYRGENASPAQKAWTPAPDGSPGATRRLEAAWYPRRPHPTGAFYATQFGEVVAGPDDARCSQATVRYGVTYPNVCLAQQIAPTMAEVAFPGNAVQRTFDAAGVRLPN